MDVVIRLDRLKALGYVHSRLCGPKKDHPPPLWKLMENSALVLALVVFTVLGWLWGEGPLWSWQRWLTNWRGADAGARPLDVVKVSLTTIGGIGGTGYFVIKYREWASAERADAVADRKSVV